MVKIHIEIEDNTPTEALADLRHLTEVLKPDADAAKFPIPLTGDEQQTAPVLNPTPVPPAAAPITEAPVSPAPVATSPTAGLSDLPSEAPAPAPAPSASTPAPAPADPSAPDITFDALATAGSNLIDQGKMDDVLALLKRYGVQAITQLQKETYAAFAADLRALGANI